MYVVCNADGYNFAHTNTCAVVGTLWRRGPNDPGETIGGYVVCRHRLLIALFCCVMLRTHCTAPPPVRLPTAASHLQFNLNLTHKSAKRETELAAAAVAATAAAGVLLRRCGAHVCLRSGSIPPTRQLDLYLCETLTHARCN